MSKHKLAGYAIKGDGTQETAERIKKVFEADGWDQFCPFLDTDQTFLAKENGYVGVNKSGREYKEIPLTEAEALVFGVRPATDENRVGKWWKHEDGSIIFGVEYDEEGNLHGYGFDAKEHLNWFHYEGNTHYIPCCNKKQLRTLTPADPKEVERMLEKETLKKYKVGDVVVDVYDGKIEEIDGDLKVKVDLQDASGDWSVWQYGYACLFSNGKWATIIDSEPSPDTEQADPMCDSELSSSDKPNTDKFPRMMWVWDIDAEDVKIKNIVDYDPDDPFHWHGENFCNIGHPEMKTDRYINASDTHPVTGQPATEKSVVEQIREVVENGIMADSWKLSEIKSILDK